MPHFQMHQMREVGLAVLVLALAAGFVDAVGYNVLFQIFTVHMSGQAVCCLAEVIFQPVLSTF